MSAADWAKSAMYRKGYEAGREQGRLEGQSSAVQIQMEDGRVLICQDVIDTLARAGWQLCPLSKPTPFQIVKS